MGNCVGPEKQQNKSAQTEPPKRQDPLSNHSQQHSKLLEEKANPNPAIPAAAPQNQEIKNQQAAPALAQLKRPNQKPVPVKKQNPAHPRSQREVQEVVKEQQEPRKIPQIGSKVANVEVKKEGPPSWIQGSNTPVILPVNADNKQASKAKEIINSHQIMKEQSQVARVDASWMNISSTPVYSKLVAEKPLPEIKEKPLSEIKGKAPSQIKGKPLQEIQEKPLQEAIQKPLSQMIERPKDQRSENMKILSANNKYNYVPSIKQERQSKEQSVMQKKDTHNSEIKQLSSNQILKRPQKTTSFIKDEQQNNNQLDELQRMIQSEKKFGGISISSIRLSNLHSKVNRPEANQQPAQSKVKWNNPSFISPRQVNYSAAQGANGLNSSPDRQNELQKDSNGLSSLKLAQKSVMYQAKHVKQQSQIKQIQVSHISNGIQQASKIKEGSSSLQLGQTDSKFLSKIKEKELAKHDDSLMIRQAEEMDQLQEMIMDEGSSPLKGFLWRSQLGIK